MWLCPRCGSNQRQGFPASLFRKHGLLSQTFLGQWHSDRKCDIDACLETNHFMPIGREYEHGPENRQIWCAVSRRSCLHMPAHASWSLLRPLSPNGPGGQSSEKANPRLNQGFTLGTLGHPDSPVLECSPTPTPAFILSSHKTQISSHRRSVNCKSSVPACYYRPVNALSRETRRVIHYCLCHSRIVSFRSWTPYLRQSIEQSGNGRNLGRPSYQTSACHVYCSWVAEPRR